MHQIVRLCDELTKFPANTSLKKKMKPQAGRQLSFNQLKQITYLGAKIYIWKSFCVIISSKLGAKLLLQKWELIYNVTTLKKLSIALRNIKLGANWNKSIYNLCWAPNSNLKKFLRYDQLKIGVWEAHKHSFESIGTYVHQIVKLCDELKVKLESVSFNLSKSVKTFCLKD